MINRKLDSLKNLNYTYFTVADIKYNKKKKSKMIDKVDDDFMKDKIEQDKLLLEDIDKAISEIYKDVIYEVNYNTINFNTVMNIVSPKLLSNENILKLCSEYSEKYHIEFSIEGDNVHLKKLNQYHINA